YDNYIERLVNDGKVARDLADNFLGKKKVRNRSADEAHSSPAQAKVPVRPRPASSTPQPTIPTNTGVSTAQPATPVNAAIASPQAGGIRITSTSSAPPKPASGILENLGFKRKSG